jgi:hypothetical protein
VVAKSMTGKTVPADLAVLICEMYLAASQRPPTEHVHCGRCAALNFDSERQYDRSGLLSVLEMAIDGLSRGPILMDD